MHRNLVATCTSSKVDFSLEVLVPMVVET